MLRFIEKYDLKVARYMNSLYHNQILDYAMKFFTFLGNLGLLWIGLSIFFISRKTLRQQGILLICALALTTLLGEGLIKHIVRRQRPFVALGTSHQIRINIPRTYSFPSGHTASSFAASAIFVAIDSHMSVLIIIISTLIALSRLYFNVHYLSDVIVGALLGLGCGLLTAYLFNAII